MCLLTYISSNIVWNKNKLIIDETIEKIENFKIKTKKKKTNNKITQINILIF